MTIGLVIEAYRIVLIFWIDKDIAQFPYAPYHPFQVFYRNERMIKARCKAVTHIQILFRILEDIRHLLGGCAGIARVQRDIAQIFRVDLLTVQIPLR